VSFLLDTSAWIPFFRDRGTPANREISRLVRDDPAAVLGCPPVRMELAVDPQDLRRRRVLFVYDSFPSSNTSEDDYDFAAVIHRAVRRNGHTVRSKLDCVIAAVATRNGATLVHNDVDFDRISAAVPELAVLRLPSS
jgi:predicted nucleic acid-binding protein